VNGSNPCEPAVSSEDNSHQLGDSSLIRGNEIYVVWGVVFIITMITGTILLAMSAGCGFLVQQLVIHRR
jgi:hypothetical protein